MQTDDDTTIDGWAKTSPGDRNIEIAALTASFFRAYAYIMFENGSCGHRWSFLPNAQSRAKGAGIPHQHSTGL
jgi:hypothetical protein